MPADVSPRGPPRPQAPGNRLLAALTRGERALLAGVMRPVPLQRGQALIEPGEEVGHVILPESGLVSLILALPDGSGGEVGVIGREGIVGLSALLGEPHAPFRAVVRVPGEAQRIPVANLRLLADRSANLRDLIRRQASAALLQASAIAACHASHLLEQRVARWLLAAADRVGQGFPLTQDDLAASLGARRPTVNGVLSAFQKAGLIRHTRGHLALSAGAGLEARSCACIGIFRRILPRVMQGGAGDRDGPGDGAEPPSGG